MKYLYAVGITALFAVNVSAQEESLGVSVQGDQTIYYSFKLDNGLRLEPSIFFYQGKESRTNFSSEYEYSHERYEVLFGIFKVETYTDKTSIFYGSRVGYVATHNRFKGYSDEDEHSEGYKIEPTIGFEYKVAENVAISADASINYINVNGKGATDQTTYTDTEVSVRYYF